MSDQEFRTSSRGLIYAMPIPSEYGGNVEVHTSSAASGPHIWLTATAPVSLNEPEGPTVEASMHLTAENAAKLAHQILALVEQQ